MRHRTHTLALLALLSTGLLVRAGGEAASAIAGPRLHDHVRYLASDELEGRDTGSPGERLAGDYLARAFAEYGLEPLGEDGGYFLPFQVSGDARLVRAALRVEREGFYRDFEPRRDATPFPFTASGKVDAPLVFAGYGITDPSRGYDDYEGLDVRGKAVLVLRHEPREREGQFSNHAHFATKARNAAEHGAVALLVVTDPLHHPGDDALLPFGGGADELGVVAFHVKQSLVQGLFRLAGKDLTQVQREIDEALAPRSFDLGARLAADVEVERTPVTARNVVGRLPGGDPKLAHEVVVVGAHYDHVGRGGHGSLDPNGSGEIHNGADDNASGTAGMLELARAFSGAGKRPRRSIVFVGFSGEERGLLGSQAFVRQPPLPLENVVAMINLDMIGRMRNESVEVGGVGTSPGFRALAERAVATQKLRATYDPSGYGPSDHASFYAAKVPVLFFFTGLHEDYHRPGDDAEKIDAEGAARVARAAFHCIDGIAEADERPGYVEVPRQARGGRGGPRLGVVLDRAQAGGGVKVERVAEGGPAARAGLRAGDVIVRLGEVDIDTAADLTGALRQQKVGEPVTVVVLREGERVTLEVRLARQ
ncbi:MAG: M20/M25/M40 family metallo-hydrolase [Planctomycetes bacterium]|nr:M20/M25/M40 family metallo-hydrolase [Planctomycetota bacterium]